MQVACKVKDVYALARSLDHPHNTRMEGNGARKQQRRRKLGLSGDKGKFAVRIIDDTNGGVGAIETLPLEHAQTEEEGQPEPVKDKRAFQR